MQPQEFSEPQSASADHAALPFADDEEQIAVVRLTKWLDWVTQKNRDVSVALPMIQRGSVWDANRIANLWDSLLRGMPTGSLTVYRAESEEPMMRRDVGEPKAREENIKKGSLFLLDGQQRTLAMCIGWPWEKEKEVPRRVWVDFGQAGIVGQRFRLRVTTEYQPFGFNQNDQSKRLQRWERRKARETFDAIGENKTRFEDKPDYKLPLDETKPYGAVHPLELRRLIQDWQNTSPNIETWVQNTLTRLSLPDAEPKEDIEKRIRDFAKALGNLFLTQIALVRVKQDLVAHDVDDEDGNSAPALVVLFARIANGGMPLSNADYIFSLIKHRFPPAHNLVQELHDKKNVSCLLTENDLVMTAVRLAANTHTYDGGTPFADNPLPNPKEFGRMLKRKVDGVGDGDFLGSALMPLIKSDSRFSLHKAFEEAHYLLEFRDGLNPPDPGLPKLAFPLLQRQLVQVLVLWIHRRHRAVESEEILRKQFDAARAEILRFVLFWLLCVENREKEKELAGKVAFKILRERENESFPSEELYKQLCDEKLAVRLQHPDTLGSSIISLPTPDAKIRSNHTRFYTTAAEGTVSESEPLYHRWFFRKELLLWLQRKTLVVEFEGANPLAGRDEETPYDYDHICPGSDWATDFRSSNFAFKGFCENEQAWVIGNCIGNYRVEESSSNRSHGDDPAPCKLRLSEMDAKTHTILKKSAITREEAKEWNECSVAKDGQGRWDEVRALAFQKVVEKRALRLFKQYFLEGGFAEWVPAPRVESTQCLAP